MRKTSQTAKWNIRPNEGNVEKSEWNDSLLCPAWTLLTYKQRDRTDVRCKTKTAATSHLSMSVAAGCSSSLTGSPSTDSSGTGADQRKRNSSLNIKRKHWSVTYPITKEGWLVYMLSDETPKSHGGPAFIPFVWVCEGEADVCVSISSCWATEWRDCKCFPPFVTDSRSALPSDGCGMFVQYEQRCWPETRVLVFNLFRNQWKSNKSVFLVEGLCVCMCVWELGGAGFLPMEE